MTKEASFVVSSDLEEVDLWVLNNYLLSFRTSLWFAMVQHTNFKSSQIFLKDSCESLEDRHFRNQALLIWCSREVQVCHCHHAYLGKITFLAFVR